MDMRMAMLKPLMPGWIKAAWARLVEDKDLVMKSWAKAGISPRFQSALRERAHQLHDEGKLFPDGLFASPENAQDVVPEELTMG